MEFDIISKMFAWMNSLIARTRACVDKFKRPFEFNFGQ